METVPHLFGCFLEAGRRYRTYHSSTSMLVVKPSLTSCPIFPSSCLHRGHCCQSQTPKGGDDRSSQRFQNYPGYHFDMYVPIRFLSVIHEHADPALLVNNPLDFPEPHVFKPSRWYGVSESETLMFGAGPRNCVGRKFALTKSLNLLAHILHDWKLDIELKPGETREGYEKRVMGTAGFDGTAFSVGRFGLKFIRRAGLL